MPSDTVISECSISPQPPAPPSSVVSDSPMDDEHKNGDLFRNDVDGDDLDVTEEDQPLEGEPEPILIYVSPVKNAKKSNLKKDQSKKTTNSVRFDPLTLLLDASLQGELDHRSRCNRKGNLISLKLFETYVQQYFCCMHVL